MTSQSTKQIWSINDLDQVGTQNTPVAFFDEVFKNFIAKGTTGSTQEFVFKNCTTILPNPAQFGGETGKIALWNSAEQTWQYPDQTAYGFNAQGFFVQQITLPVEHTNYLFLKPTAGLTKPKLNPAKTEWVEGATLPDLKIALKAENQQQLNLKIAAGLDFESVNYQINERSRVEFNQTLTRINAGLISAPIKWRDAQNQMQTLSLEKFKQLVQAVFEAYSNLLQKYWQTQAKINALNAKPAASNFNVQTQWN